MPALPPRFGFDLGVRLLEYRMDNLEIGCACVRYGHVVTGTLGGGHSLLLSSAQGKLLKQNGVEYNR